MQTNIFYLMQVILNLCSDLKAPIYSIAENILFCLMFTQIVVWLEKQLIFIFCFPIFVRLRWFREHIQNKCLSASVYCMIRLCLREVCGFAGCANECELQWDCVCFAACWLHARIPWGSRHKAKFVWMNMNQVYKQLEHSLICLIRIYNFWRSMLVLTPFA
jgi:hypothetical protein